MKSGVGSFKLFLMLTILHHRLSSINSVSSVCELSFLDRNNLYNYSLASPTPKFPHGILNEDGFYKVAVNETVLRFQLCDGMIFNHDPPRCVDCLDCGGPTRCGMECSALVAENVGGYSVCTTVGRATNIDINVIDKKNLHMGVVIKMSSSGPKHNCSLSVSVLCDSNGVQGPHSLDKLETCDYATVLRHPLGCAKIVSFHGKGWGWFSIFITIMFCLFGGYLLAGTVYRYFVLGVRGIDVIPNLTFWTAIPQRSQSFVSSSVSKFKGPSEGYRSSYSPVNF